MARIAPADNCARVSGSDVRSMLESTCSNSASTNTSCRKTSHKLNEVLLWLNPYACIALLTKRALRPNLARQRLNIMAERDYMIVSPDVAPPRDNSDHDRILPDFSRAKIRWTTA